MFFNIFNNNLDIFAVKFYVLEYLEMNKNAKGPKIVFSF